MPNYTSFKDMFDGGGAGRSGSTFQGGGLLSSAANRVASPIGSRGSQGQMRPQSRPDMTTMAARQSSNPGFIRDMFDGGGMGAQGDTFQGGLYGGLLNMFGILPAGARDRATLQSYRSAQSAPPAVQAAIQAAQTPVASPTQAAPPAPAPAFLPDPDPVYGPYPLTPFGDTMARLDRDGINYRLPTNRAR